MKNKKSAKSSKSEKSSKAVKSAKIVKSAKTVNTEKTKTDYIGRTGEIGYLLLTIASFGNIGQNKNALPAIYFAYILGYALITIEKIGPFSDFSFGHILLGGLYLTNLVWCPFLEEDKKLIIALIIMHLAMIKPSSKYIKYFNLFALMIYGYIALTLFMNDKKSTLETIKMVGALVLVIYNVKSILDEDKINKKK
jgi:hypothetical protein